MKKLLPLFAILIAASTSASAQETASLLPELAKLEVTSTTFSNGDSIPVKNAYCIRTEKEKSSPKGENLNPQLSWSKGPEGTKSYAIVAVDKDVPEDFSDANQEGRTIKESAKRQNFYHWIWVDIPANVTSIEEGKSKILIKEFGTGGTNSYAEFMKDMPAENFKGYDGPCPPFNDKKVHNYYFQVYALSTEKLALPEFFTADEVLKAIEPFTLAKGEVLGTYSLFKK
jgi:Raf kinase inhibitor-like YbhB/YbcL family protein